MEILPVLGALGGVLDVANRFATMNSIPVDSAEISPEKQIRSWVNSLVEKSKNHWTSAKVPDGQLKFLKIDLIDPISKKAEVTVLPVVNARKGNLFGKEHLVALDHEGDQYDIIEPKKIKRTGMGFLQNRAIGRLELKTSTPKYDNRYQAEHNPEEWLKNISDGLPETIDICSQGGTINAATNSNVTLENVLVRDGFIKTKAGKVIRATFLIESKELLDDLANELFKKK
ncbi:MAG: hypothetical protein Q8L51_01630 [Candidatus Amesbacteria bacterium]|nr:hypothetical protein [Candidatus Amesbacteria bacterium]